MELPSPSGSHWVGTETHYLIAPGRGTPLDESGDRPLAAQVWYPAAGQGGRRELYVAESEVLEVLLREGYYEQPSERVEAWGRLATHSWAAVPLLRSASPLPVILFSHGLGLLRSSYTAILEGLASRGVVVIAISHPHGGISRTAAGSVLSLKDDAAIGDDPAVIASYEAAWAADLTFALDWLSQGGSRIVTPSSIDLERVAAIGHSLGGAAAYEACRTDPRIKACVNMDGFSFGPVRLEGVGAPALYLKSSPVYSDQDHAARGRTRRDWEEMVSSIRPQLTEPLRHASSRPAYFVEVKGTGHMSFSDAPFLMPDALNRFGGVYLPAERTLELTLTTIGRFLDKHLLERHAPPLDEALEELRELDWTVFD